MASAKLTALSDRGTVLTGDLLYVVPAAGAAEYKGTAAGIAAFVAANGITLAGTAGVLTATAPTQTASAQAGVGWIVAASDAVAGASNAGAADGGGLAFYSGNAKRLASGNAVGGLITFIAGEGIGTGTGGSVAILGGDTSSIGTTGGPIYLEGGTGFSSTATGGLVSLKGGENDDDGCLGGSIILGGGTGAGAGGDVSISGGYAASNDGNGGSVVLTPGLQEGAGTVGKVIIRQPGGAVETWLTGDSGITKYRDIVTAGYGVAVVVAAGTLDGQTARSAALATFTVGAADGLFEISGGVEITASTNHSFSLNCEYTDETNSAVNRVMPLGNAGLGGFVASGLITNVVGEASYATPAMAIRAKAGTTITIRPNAGTYTSVTYNAFGVIKQVA